MTQDPEDPLVQLTASLYEAAGDPERYNQFAAELQTSLGASMAFMPHAVRQPGLSWYESARPGVALAEESIVAASNFPTSAQLEFEEWVLADGFTNAAMVRGMVQGSTVFDRREFCSDHVFRHLPFYSEVARPHDAFHLIGGAIFAPDRRFGMFLLLGRPEGLAPFTPRDLALVTHLLPHFAHAQRLHLQLSRLKREQGTRALALDLMDRACLAVDASLNVLWTNAAAEQRIAPSTGISIRGGKVCLSGPMHTQLQDAVRRCTLLGTDAAGRAGDTLRLLPLRPVPAVQITVLPVPGARPGTGALLLVDDEKPLPSAPAHLLQQRYGLTPAEGRVAGLLSAGHSVGDIAERLQVTTGTIRNQLKQVFAKTDTHRQSQLVRLVLGLTDALI